MSANTSIEWTDRTWNPVRGCALVSEGCRNCYAMKQAHRFSGVGQPYEGLTELGPAGPRWTGKIRTVDAALTAPLSWRKPQRIFVNSMSDLFHEGVPDEFIDRVFAVMALASRHTFQILTKRPERMRAYVTARVTNVADAIRGLNRKHADVHATTLVTGLTLGAEPPRRLWPLRNVWLGVSVENQKAADERIPHLLLTPAAVRFLSCEPLLGPIDLEHIKAGPLCPQQPEHRVDVLRRGTWDLRSGFVPKGQPDFINHSDMERIDWVIPGGESGVKPRPCEIAWLRSLAQQCAAAGTACFAKQLGADARGECNWPHHAECPPMVLDNDGVLSTVSGQPGTLCHAVEDAWWPCRLKLKDRKGGDMAEWPEDLRVRQFPVIQGEAVAR